MQRFLLAALLLGAAWAEPPRKLDILFVGAHPDDDSTATATLARFAAQGKRIGVVTATRGEQGGNLIGSESGAALGLMREGEQRAALTLLGIPTVHYLECQDSGFTTSIRVSESNWGRQQALQRLVRLIRYHQPEVLITMSPAPRGHGDHQLISQLTSEAFFASAHSGGEGLPAWAPRKLFYTLEYGEDGLKPSVSVPVGEFAGPELQALGLYRSQWSSPTQPQSEPFVLAASRVPGSGLMDGLDTNLQAPAPRRKPPARELQRTPALTRFLTWSRGLGLNLEILAPATRVCRAGQTVRWPLGSSTETVKAPATLGPHSLQVGGLPAVLQVVPSLTLGKDRSAWQTIDSTWEGKNGGSMDCSGRFRLRLTAQDLQVEAIVIDDHLLADLPPGENRAHWRTDALEITVDPSGTSQDTTSTFKLGVILKNTAGRAMAVRDADAHPGPWGGQIQATYLANGYQLRVDIPRRDLPAPLAREFGFNLLLYDADPGESPSRLAWSAWETVQGWPELWGRILREK